MAQLICACGRGVPLAHAFFCDTACFELRCELCSSQLLDPAAAMCGRCGKSVSPSEPDLLHPSCGECLDCPACGRACSVKRAAPGAPFAFVCDSCAWTSRAYLTAASPSGLRDALEVATRESSSAAVGVALGALARQSALIFPWMRGLCEPTSGHPGSQLRVHHPGRGNEPSPGAIPAVRFYAAQPPDADAREAAARRVDAARAGVECQLTCGMLPVALGDGEDTRRLEPAEAVRAARERKDAHASLQAHRGTLLADGSSSASSLAPGEGSSVSVSGPATAHLLPVGHPAVPLPTRRCLVCRAAGRSGLLARSQAADAAGGSAAPRYEKLSLARTLLPRVTAHLPLPHETPALGEGCSVRLRLWNTMEGPTVAALVFLPGDTRQGHGATVLEGSDGQHHVLLPVHPTAVATMQADGSAAPMDLRPLPVALASVTWHGRETLDGRTSKCVILPLGPCNTAEFAAEQEEDARGRPLTETSEEGDADQDSANPSGSPLWSELPPHSTSPPWTPTPSFVDVLLSLPVQPAPAPPASALRVGLAVAVPASVITARTGAGLHSLPAGAVRSQCTLTVVLELPLAAA